MSHEDGNHRINLERIVNKLIPSECEVSFYDFCGPPKNVGNNRMARNLLYLLNSMRNGLRNNHGEVDIALYEEYVGMFLRLFQDKLRGLEEAEGIISLIKIKLRKVLEEERDPKSYLDNVLFWMNIVDSNSLQILYPFLTNPYFEPNRENLTYFNHLKNWSSVIRDELIQLGVEDREVNEIQIIVNAFGAQIWERQQDKKDVSIYYYTISQFLHYMNLFKTKAKTQRPIREIPSQIIKTAVSYLYTSFMEYLTLIREERKLESISENLLAIMLNSINMGKEHKELVERIVKEKAKELFQEMLNGLLVLYVSYIFGALDKEGGVPTPVFGMGSELYQKAEEKMKEEARSKIFKAFYSLN